MEENDQPEKSGKIVKFIKNLFGVSTLLLGISAVVLYLLGYEQWNVFAGLGIGSYLVTSFFYKDLIWLTDIAWLAWLLK